VISGQSKDRLRPRGLSSALASGGPLLSPLIDWTAAARDLTYWELHLAVLYVTPPALTLRSHTLTSQPRQQALLMHAAMLSSSQMPHWLAPAPLSSVKVKAFDRGA